MENTNICWKSWWKMFWCVMRRSRLTRFSKVRIWWVLKQSECSKLAKAKFKQEAQGRAEPQGAWSHRETTGDSRSLPFGYCLALRYSFTLCCWCCYCCWFCCCGWCCWLLVLLMSDFWCLISDVCCLILILGYSYTLCCWCWYCCWWMLILLMPLMIADAADVWFLV